MKYTTYSLRSHLKRIDVPDSIAVICIVKNEGRYIREFVEYYIGLGCDIVAYDNGSTDNTAEILKEYPEHIKYIFYPGVKRQIDAYNQALKRFKGEYKYLIYVDADEFLVSDDVINGKKLIDVINDFFKKSRSIACLGINWLIFGSAGYKEFPAEGGVLENFTRCSQDCFERNRLVKSVVKPELTIGFVNPHLPLVAAGYKAVNLDGYRINNPEVDLPIRRDIRIYHYFCKNKQWFAEKIDRGMADNLRKMKMDFFDYCDRNELYNDKAAIMKNLLKKQNIEK